jgi:chromate transporter
VELFLAFAKMSLAGFGGVLVGARRGIVAPLDAGTVEQSTGPLHCAISCRRPNIVNLSVVSGSRFGGIAGAPAAPGAFWVSLALSDENR